MVRLRICFFARERGGQGQRDTEVDEESGDGCRVGEKGEWKKM